VLEPGWTDIELTGISATIALGSDVTVIKKLIEIFPEGVTNEDILKIIRWSELKTKITETEELINGNQIATREKLKSESFKGILLHYAADIDDIPIRIINSLIKAYPEGIKIKNDNGKIPAHYANKRNSSNYLDKKNEKNSLDQKAVVSALTEGLDLNEIIKSEASERVILEKISKEPESVKIIDEEGRLPLHNALILRYSKDVINSLLEKYQDAIKVKDNDGLLPLHIASLSKGMNEGNFDVFKIILDKYKDAAKGKTNKGLLPIDFATWDNIFSTKVKNLLSGITNQQ